MAALDRDPTASGPVIQAYVGTGFRIDGRLYPAGVLLTPRDVRVWDAGAIDQLSEADFAAVLDLTPPPEFLLLGTGAVLRRPAPAVIAAIEARGLAVEIMDSRAAARAWGVLRGEDRWIAAALMPFADG